MGALPEWNVEGGMNTRREGTRGRRRRDVVNVQFSSGGTAKSRELFMERLLKSHGWRAPHSQNMFVRVTCYRGKRLPPRDRPRSALSLFFLEGITWNARAAKKFLPETTLRKPFAWNGYSPDFRINERINMRRRFAQLCVLWHFAIDAWLIQHFFNEPFGAM